MDVPSVQTPGAVPREAAAVAIATTTTSSPSSATSALQDIAFGSLAGTVGKVVEYPFDTIKVRLQSQPDHLPLRYTGPLDCFRQSIATDGLRSLYRGVSAPLAGAAAETACLFWSYGMAKDVLRLTILSPHHQAKDDLPLPAMVTAGAISGGITSLILTPIELVKCLMQVPLPASPTAPSRQQHPTPIAVIRDIYQRSGVRGFWRGQFGTFLRETGGTAAWFGGYEASSLAFKKRIFALQQQEQSRPLIKHYQRAEDVTLPLSYQMLSGALAGMSYNFLFYPADTIKSRMQTSSQQFQASFWNVGKDLYRTRGLKGLYRGCGITVARSAPSSALIFTIVENLKRMSA